MHEGWAALKRMLADIEAGRIEVVVVYKVDRLTRSAHDLSFISVTQGV
jgi:site-specific DNA recombinase